MNCKNFATRALSMLLCIVMLVGMIPVSVSAEDAINLTLDTVSIDVNTATTSSDANGEYYTATVNLIVTDNAGFITLAGKLEYPKELKLLSTTDGALNAALNAWNSSEDEDLKANPYMVAWEAAGSESNVTSTGTLMTFTFRVPVTESNATYPITFTPTEVKDADLVTDLTTSTSSATGAIKTVGAPVIYTGSTLLKQATVYNSAIYKNPTAATATAPAHYHFVKSSTDQSMEIHFDGDYKYYPSTYPYVKIYYRTNIMDGENVAVPSFGHTRSDGGFANRTEFSQYYEYISASSSPATEVGEWGSVIYKISHPGFTDNVWCSSIDVVFPSGATESDYVDVAFVGLFATETAAKDATLEPEFKVTFDVNGETFATQDIWASGAPLAYPETLPTMQGVEFDKWVDEYENAYEAGTPITKDTTLYARFVGPVIYSGEGLIQQNKAYDNVVYTDPTAATETDPAHYHFTKSSSDQAMEIHFDGDYKYYPSTYPYVKIYYRTNIMKDGNVAVPSFGHTRSDGGFENRFSFGTYYEYISASDPATKVGEWGSVIYKISHPGFTDNVWCRSIDVVFPGATGDGATAPGTVSADNYVDVARIGFFKSEAAALSDSIDAVSYCLVKFVVDGKAYETKYVASGSALEYPATSPAAPEGTVFGGWVDAEGNVVEEGSTVRGDITLTAMFAEPVDIIFMNGDEEFYKMTVTTGSKLVYPEATPVKKYSEFMGWVDADGAKVEEGTVINSAMILYADFFESQIYTGSTLLKQATVYNSALYKNPTAATATAPAYYHFTKSSSDQAMEIHFDGDYKYYPATYPYVKIYYRTNIMDGENVAVPSFGHTRSDGGFQNRFSFGTFYEYINSSDPATEVGEWGSVIYKISHPGFTDKVWCSSIDVVFPGATGDGVTAPGTVSADNYVDVAFVGFFATETAAKAATLEPEFKVTFNVNGETFATQDIWASGAPLAYPANEVPVPEGMLFNGWVNAEGVIVEEETPVTENLTLYASYTGPVIYSGEDLFDQNSVYDNVIYTDPTAATETDPAHYHFTKSSSDQAMEIHFDGDYKYYPSTYPYVKIYYRTNIMDGENVAVPSFGHTRSDGGFQNRFSFGTYYEYISASDPATKVGEWGSVIYKISHPAFTDKVWCNSIDVVFPGATGDGVTAPGTVSADNYVDVAYIGFFMTEDSAKNATFDVIVPEEPTTATVKFMNGDEIFDEQTVEIGSTIVLPATDPEKDGYRFDGWDVAEDAIVEADMVINAKFVEQITVTFEVNGEKYDEKVIDINTAPEYPADPDLEGYRFDGWSVEAGTTFAENTTVTAKLTAITTVIFMNGEEVHEEQTDVVVGSTIVLPEVAPAKDGYRFDGWETVDGTEVTAATIVEADMVIEAVFVQQFTVTFMVDGEVYGEVLTVDAGATLVLPETLPEVDGYRFNGWDKEAGIAINKNTVVNAILVQQVAVRFYVDGKLYEEYTVDVGSKLVYPETDPVSETDDWVFDGWNKEAGKEINAAMDVTAKLTDKYLITIAATDGGKFTVNDGEELTEYEAKVLEGTTLNIVPVADKDYRVQGCYDNNDLVYADEAGNFEYIVIRDANLEIRFIKATVAPTVALKVDENVNYGGGDVSVGEKAELEAKPVENKKLAYWVRETNDGAQAYIGASDKVEVDALGSAVVYTPIYVDTIVEKVVLYINHQGIIVAVDPADTPAVPTEIGFTYSDWANTRTETSADGVLVEIWESEREKTSTDDPHTLTVNFANGTTKDYEFQTYEYFFFSSTVNEDVQWVLDGTVVSYSSSFGFHIAATADATLNEVVLELEAEPIILGISAKYDAGAKKIVFTASQDVPDSVEFYQCGVLLAKEGSGIDTDKMTVETNGVIVGRSSGSSADTSTFIIRKGNVAAGDTWYGRPYLIYKTSDGRFHTIYADTMEATATAN